MTKEHLVKYCGNVWLKQRQLEEAKETLEAAKRKYCEETGIPVGTKVKIKPCSNKIGVVREKMVFGAPNNIKIQYRIAKITKSGKAHKTANISWIWYDKDELEIIEDGEVKND